MPKNDLQDSVRENVIELAHQLKVFEEENRKLQNYISSLKTKIIDYCEIYGIENGDIDDFVIELVPSQRPIPLEELLTVFPNYDIKSIIENVVAEIKIDMEETEKNLRFSGNFQDAIIKGIIKQLDKLTNITVKEIKLK